MANEKKSVTVPQFILDALEKLKLPYKPKK